MNKKISGLLRFFDSDISSIPGWFSRDDAELIAALSVSQSRRSVTGNILELGVWEGRSLMFLASLKEKSEKCYGVDNFLAPERKNRVIDLARADTNRHNLHIVQGDTKQFRHYPDLAPESCRIVHVDADHEHSSVVTDLEVARRFLLPAGGLLVLDDLPHRNWPGVWSAMAQWILQGGGDEYRPFLISHSKGYLVRKDEVTFWKRAAIELLGEERFVAREVFDIATLVFEGPEGPPVMPVTLT